MATKIKKEEKLQNEEMAATISGAEQFYNENKKTIWGVIICILVVGLAILGYSKFIYAPQAKEAQEAAFPAELSFQQGEFELALNGDGNALGFAQIIGQTVFGSAIEIARMVILIIGVILFFVTLLGSVPAIRYLMALKPTEVLHGK